MVPGPCSVFTSYHRAYGCFPGPPCGIPVVGASSIISHKCCGLIGSCRILELRPGVLSYFKRIAAFWSVPKTGNVQVVRTGLGLHNTISSLRLRAVEAFCGIAPLFEEARSIHGPGPRSLIQTDRLVFGHARPGLRRAIGFKFTLMADGQPTIVAVPLRRALAGIWCHTSTAVLAFLFAYWSSTIFARPLGRTSTSIGPRAVAAVAARRRADGRRAIRVEPAVPVWQAKFKLCFNLRCVAVWVRCYSLNTVSTISRRSCPSLGLSEGRGAEIT